MQGDVYRTIFSIVQVTGEESSQFIFGFSYSCTIFVHGAIF